MIQGLVAFASFGRELKNINDTRIGSIRIVWAGAKKYKFSFLLRAGPLSFKCITAASCRVKRNILPSIAHSFPLTFVILLSIVL